MSRSHIAEPIRIDDPWKRVFYENECLLGGTMEPPGLIERVNS